jgi:hypothetical protein
MSNGKNNTIPVTNRQPLLSTVMTQDGSTLPFSDDIDVTSGENIDIAGDDIDKTSYIDETADIDVTAYILARAETRTPAATPVRASVNRMASVSVNRKASASASVNRTASTSTSFAARLGRLRSPVGPPNMTRNVRIPDRSPDRSPGRSPERSRGGPARRSDGVKIAVDVEFNQSGAASPQQSDNDGEEEEEDDDDDDGTP